MVTLAGARVSLRRVAAEDGDAFVRAARESVGLHRHLIYAPTSAAEFAEYLARFDGVQAIGFVVVLNGNGELAGLVNLNGIVDGRRASLGFGGFAATSGHGYVGEGVLLAVRYAFGELGFERLDADVQPGNAASRKVVERAGFRPAGTARKSIRIEGELREHEAWVLMAGDGLRKNV